MMADTQVSLLLRMVIIVVVVMQMTLVTMNRIKIINEKEEIVKWSAKFPEEVFRFTMARETSFEYQSRDVLERDSMPNSQK